MTDDDLAALVIDTWMAGAGDSHVDGIPNAWRVLPELWRECQTRRKIVARCGPSAVLRAERTLVFHDEATAPLRHAHCEHPTPTRQKAS